MKEALKAKDKMRYHDHTRLYQSTYTELLTVFVIPRLNVLRGILTETTSLEKESKGIKTNKQLYKLLQKRKNASSNAAKEFQAASRQDLTEKENEQIAILQGYLDGFAVTPADEVVGAVQATIQILEVEGVTPNKDKVRARLFRPNGALEGKILDEALVAKTINLMVHEVSPSKPSPVQA